METNTQTDSWPGLCQHSAPLTISCSQGLLLLSVLRLLAQLIPERIAAPENLPSDAGRLPRSHTTRLSSLLASGLCRDTSRGPFRRVRSGREYDLSRWPSHHRAGL